MLRDLKCLRLSSGKNPPEGNENLPSDQTGAALVSSGLDPERAPLNTILESSQNPITVAEPEPGLRSKADKTPSRNKGKILNAQLQFRTPEKPGVGSNLQLGPAKSKLGWVPRSESCASRADDRDEVGQAPSLYSLSGRGATGGNWGFSGTPRAIRTGGRASSNQSEGSSTQSTPTKSVTKPPNSASAHISGSRPPLGLGTRTGNFALMSRGISSSCVPTTVVNTVEVPYFELREDPSFWMHHNVQVIIRVRPPNNTELSLYGYNRCLKQDSAQTITWIGQPESRFKFDHVACENVNQEMLFRVAGLPMVENCLSGYNSCMFAYGQTGSGKTYTMLGEIDELEVKPSPDRGMTPRIFEFLFARIRSEEESRRDEKLKYSCKCSFLEIYNEQITDLLDPSSTNLLLREDIRKGVYVENLTEIEVQSVGDILRLLVQGAANRKIAATHMNRESSRSHSVFTCIVESRWEKDSTTNLRYARLNLVDLAGSERQKTSGAEGERLKEAANINKSLSTLGHVIMVLVDLAQGKQKHVPYRDSRLTFLLQDSLGGNSKTMIIANVSPSICSAAETLSTLRFAQRAKLIQNNAVVNEDASGDVIALQHQIRFLKEELYLLKRQNVSRSLSFQPAIIEETEGEGCAVISESKLSEVDNSMGDESPRSDSSGVIRVSSKQLKSLEIILAGALRREQMADTMVKQLQAEIEQLNRLVRQREEDNRCTKMMLRFREEKIRTMEAVVNGLLPPDSYLNEQNNTLAEEIQLLQTRIDKNPEVTRFALENIRLLDQLRRFQDFYEEGEREILLSEISQLRDQLFVLLDGRSSPEKDQMTCGNPQHQIGGLCKVNEPLYSELKKSREELEECRKSLNSCLELNTKLSREVDDLKAQLNSLKSISDCQDARTQEESDFVGGQVEGNFKQEITMKHAEEIMNLQLELDIMKVILDEERSSRHEVNERASRFSKDLEVTKDELKNAKSIIEALEAQQILLINEIEELRDASSRYVELLKKGDPLMKSADNDSVLQAKLKRMQASLERARRLNSRYQVDQACHNSRDIEMDEIRRQVEAETAEVIVCLQEELTALQQQAERNNLTETEIKQENRQLLQLLEDKEEELRLLTEEWERMACEVSETLASGHLAFEEVSDQVTFIADSFSQRRTWVGEQVGKMARIVSEKELLIEELQSSLDDAYKMRDDLEWKLRSLRGATLAITEAQQQESLERENEIIKLKSEVNQQKSSIHALKSEIEIAEAQTRKAEVHATVAFIIVNRLSKINSTRLHDLKGQETQQIQALKRKLEEAEDEAALLNLKLAEENKRVCTIESRIADDILRTKERVKEFNVEVTSLRSSMSEFVEDLVRPNKDKSVEKENFTLKNEENFGGRMGNEVTLHLSNDVAVSQESSEDLAHADATILLLRKEIESALDCLRGVQTQMTNLLVEKEEIKKSEQQSQRCVESLREQVLKLQNEMNNLEKQCELQTHEQAKKLQIVEEMAEKAKKLLEYDLSELKTVEAQKTAENLCLLTKLELARASMEEADAMINASLAANKEVKIEVERYKEMEATLTNERDHLINEVQNLRISNNLKVQQYEQLEEQFCTNLAEMSALVEDLEDLLQQISTMFTKETESVVSDIQRMRCQVVQSMSVMRTSLEDTWSEIIVKDCAVSVLHLCHMGVLLEAVTGLNAENGLLHHGLAESSTVIADLRRHNFKAKRELEICSALKGKLLADIRNSFHRITSKEEETGKLVAKISLFEKKVLDMQMQEETMLALSNSMGFELSALTKEMDQNKRSALAAFHEQEKLLKKSHDLFMDSLCKELDLLIGEYCRVPDDSGGHLEDLMKYKMELLMVELSAKDIEMLIFASEFKQKALLLQETTVQKEYLKSNQDKCRGILEDLSCKMILATLDGELRRVASIDEEAETILLKKDVSESREIISRMETEKAMCDLEILSLKAIIEGLESTLKGHSHELVRLKELMDINNTISAEVQALRLENKRHVNDLQEKGEALEAYMLSITKLQTELKLKNEELQGIGRSNSVALSHLELKERELVVLGAKLASLQNEHVELHTAQEMKHKELQDTQHSYTITQSWLEAKEQELVLLSEKLRFIEKENDELKINVEDLKANNSRASEELHKKELEFSSFRSQCEEKICCLESCLTALQSELDTRSLKLQKTESSSNLICKENKDLRNGVMHMKQKNSEMLTMLNRIVERCSNRVEALGLVHNRLFALTIEKDNNAVLLDTICHEICDYEDRLLKLLAEYQCLETFVGKLVSDNESLHTELERKEEIMKSLLFDLSLLQESASSVKDQKDEFADMVATLESLEEDLEVKSNELDEALSHAQTLQAELQERGETISVLELEFAKANELLQVVSGENLEMKAQIEDLLAIKTSTERELGEENMLTQRLEAQLLEMDASLRQTSDLLEGFNNDIIKLTHERDCVKSEVLVLKEQLEMAQALAEENEAIATEARQIAEASKLYAVDKEEEVKLLEKSIEELESTIDVMENKVDIIKEEAERQRLQREELEIELQAVRHQLLTVQDSNDFSRRTEEILKDLEEAERKIQYLEKDVKDKDAEISQCKVHINELNMHAEAQAHEYKQKFKALEAMVQDVKSESAVSSHPATTNKLEKNPAKSRGSGSPFKCIGLGLAHQINAEKDEDLLTAKLKIEELEALAATQKKEILMLKTRLATAESMTHDVIRDLLGVKLEMTSCASLLDHQQVKKMAEKAKLHSEESAEMEQEVVKLKRKLKEFIEERQRWLDEINHKHAEMIASQVGLEKLRQRDHSLTQENELLKAENANHKKRAVELEGEIKKLSGQQNLQQRIHHHAKIKEENNALRTANDDLSAKLRRIELTLSRTRDELARYHASSGREPFIDIDEEQRLKDQLKDMEEERVQLAQKLLGLCANILKAAGISRPGSDVTLAAAEEALLRLEDRVVASERELQDLKFKNKMSSEKMRLAELRQQSSPLSERTNETCPTPRRLSQAPLSPLSR